MNKKLKGFICCLTALVMCLSFSGCGQKDNSLNAGDGEYPGSPVTVNGDEIYPVECEDTLTWWKEFGDGLGTGYENFGDTPIAKQIEKETGVKIEYLHPAAGSQNEQFQLMIASDELPDIVNYTWSSYPGGPQAAIDEDYIYELNDLIDKFAPALKSVLSQKPNVDKQMKTDSGSYYAVPLILEPGLLQVTYGPVIRDDMLAKLNLDKPSTIEEWDTVFKALKSDLKIEYPFVGSAVQVCDTFCSAYDIYLQDWYQDDGMVKYGFYEPAYKDLLTQLNKWYQEGYITPDFATLTSEQSRSLILNDRAAATICWAGSGMGTMLTAGQSSGSFSLAGVQYPSQKKGKNASYGYMTPEVNMYHGMAISKKCKNPELAMRYLDYGFTEKGHMTYNFGIENVSYRMVDGYPTYTDLIQNNPDGLKTSQAIGVYAMATGNAPLVQDERYIEQYYARPEVGAAQKEWLKSDMNEHMLPILSLDPAEMDEDSNAMSFIRTYIDEMRIKFIRGEEPIENFDLYIKQLENFGIKEAIARRQAAYDRFEER